MGLVYKDSNPRQLSSTLTSAWQSAYLEQFGRGVKIVMTKIAYIIIILTALLLAHLLEEVKTGFRKKFILGRIPKTIFVLFNVGIYSFALTTIILAFKNNPVAYPLAWIYAVAISLNAVLHIGIMAAKRNYFPGGITAFALLPPAVYLLVELVRLPNL